MDRAELGLCTVGDDYAKSFHYADAADTYSLLSRMPGYIEDDTGGQAGLEDERWGLLRQSPAQSTSITGPFTLEENRTPAGLLEVPVQAAHFSDHWLLDTGANTLPPGSCRELDEPEYRDPSGDDRRRFRDCKFRDSSSRSCQLKVSGFRGESAMARASCGFFFIRNSHSRRLFVTMRTLRLSVVVPRVRRAWSFTPTRRIPHRTPPATLWRHGS
jgi:hypothetical protein